MFVKSAKFLRYAVVVSGPN